MKIMGKNVKKKNTTVEQQLLARIQQLEENQAVIVEFFNDTRIWIQNGDCKKVRTKQF